VVTQHEAVSIDGERIPTSNRTGHRERDAPIYLNAYGGFGIAVRPYYNSAVGKLWLERGGTSVIAEYSRRRRVRHALARTPADTPAKRLRMMTFAGRRR